VSEAVNLAVFFTGKDSRRCTARRTRSVRQQSPNTSLRRLQPQVVRPSAPQQHLLQPAQEGFLTCRPFGQKLGFFFERRWSEASLQLSLYFR